MGIFDKEKPTFDPTTIDDPIAKKTQWGPAKRGGTSFHTHYLSRISNQRVEFKISELALLFPGLFIFIGLGISMAMVIGFRPFNLPPFIGLPLGIIFCIAGIYMMISWITPRKFDLNKGYYWKSRKEPEPHKMKLIEESCRIKSIHAIQLVQEYCSNSSYSGGSNSFYSYELNLVLKDGNRLNVIDHGNLSNIQSDAKKLSEFLNIPIWDATTQ
ncbi:MAG: hypothetical protein COA79_02405 [Planctomycetota bacterium]|nr:MAG: hypothetical protein COA79_02405 [Planctomycetota bacterium]